jgi:hypothetical protein
MTTTGTNVRPTTTGVDAPTGQMILLFGGAVELNGVAKSQTNGCSSDPLGR